MTIKTLRGTLKRSNLGVRIQKTASQGTRSLLAFLLACLLVGGPLSPAYRSKRGSKAAVRSGACRPAEW